MHRYMLTIEYRGDLFYGWQRQEISPTVQASVEDTLAIILGPYYKKHSNSLLDEPKIILQGSGRTDRGVHALCQVAHFDLPFQIDSEKVMYGLNFFLKNKGAAILSLQEVPLEFHARFSALQRVYRYIILNRRAPSILQYPNAYHVTVPLDLKKMQEGAEILSGTHDFSSFRDTECQAKSPIRTIDFFKVSKEEECIYIDVKARSFLHHQVRIMVGTLKKIAEKNESPQIIVDMLSQKKREAAGPTAPACGLFFVKTIYPASLMTLCSNKLSE